jgi:group I intron endonuclease
LNYFLIYKTTNNINGKIYIGKHKTKNFNDGYLGSGILLKLAMEKYGIENFTREIIYICKTEEDMNLKEKEIITEEFIKDCNTYNIALGGQGGNLGDAVNQKIGITMSKLLKDKKKTPQHINVISLSKKGKKVSEETKNSIKKTIKKLRQNTDEETRKKLFAHYAEENGFYQKTHSEESKQKIRDAIGDSRKGSKNPKAMPVTFRGKSFGCKKDCAEFFNISKYKLNKLLGEIDG